MDYCTIAANAMMFEVDSMIYKGARIKPVTLDGAEWICRQADDISGFDDSRYSWELNDSARGMAAAEFGRAKARNNDDLRAMRAALETFEEYIIVNTIEDN